MKIVEIFLGECWIMRYWNTYNSADLITSITYPSGQTVNYTYDKLAQLESIPGYLDGNSGTGFTYNPNGAVINKYFNNNVDYTYTYNNRNWLGTADGFAGPFVSYLYNTEDERVMKISPQGVTKYITDGNGQVLAEYDGYNNLQYNYIYGNGEKLAKINTGGTKEYYHNDYLGSVRRISTQGGGVNWSRDYYPFGETREATGANEDNHYTYEGKEKDLETDLWNNWNRHFDDEGRFMLVDPLWHKYPSLSPYVRVANNPLRFVDPYGEDITSVKTIDKNENEHYEIEYTATLVNNSNKEISQEQLQKVANTIKSQIEKSYSGRKPDGKVTWKTTSKIQVGGKPKKGDNILSIEPTPGNYGLSRVRGLTQKIDSNLATSTDFKQIGRTGAHEFGHGAGLRHLTEPSNLMKSGGKGISIYYYQILEINTSAPYSGMLP